MDRRSFTTGALALAASTVGGQSSAQSTRPIRFFVGFGPGGQSDLVARLLGQRMSQLLGRSIIVENRPGAGGSLATLGVLSQPADGETLLFATSSISLNYITTDKPRYQPLKDFDYISLLNKTSYVISVSPSFPARTVAELVKISKAEPGKYAYGSAGAGTAQHLAGELFKQIAGVDLIHVPYKGSQQADMGLLSDQVQVVFENAPIALSFAAQNQMRLLAVCNETRLKSAPDIPTTTEAGVPGFLAGTYQLLVAKAGTPPDLLEKYYGAVQKVLADPEFQESAARLVDESLPGYDKQKTFNYVQRDIERWGPVVASANIKVGE